MSLRKFTYLWKFLLLAFLCGGPVAPAGALTITHPTESEKASYRISVAGVQVGKAWLWWEANAGYYKITASLKTSGVVRIFNQRTWLAELSGKREGAAYVPIHYHATVTYPHKRKTVDMAYEHFILKDIITDPPVDTVLDKTQKRSAVDPLTGILQLLLFMADPPELQQMYGMDVFDGKRLMRASALPDAASAKSCMLPCRRFLLYRTPLLGYDAEELEELADEPPLLLQHNPAVSHFPQSLTASARIGTLRMERVAE